MPYCPECGKPVAPTAKFCRNCGASQLESADSAPAPVAVPPPGPLPCKACGAALLPDEKFCSACGAPAGQPGPAPVPAGSAAPPAPVTSAAVTGGEQVIGVIANARRKKMLGISWDTYSLVITDRRMIIVRLTQEMLNAAIAGAQAKAKAEGKGFFGIMGDQMAAQFQYARRYETMSPDAALRETPGNTAIENAAVSALDLRLFSDDDNASYSEFGLTIKSNAGKTEYHIAEDDRFITILKTAYGDRVHMPFGYFRAGGVKIKLF